ncbi:porin [Paraburkholderia dinghuensis]|uniref:Porin n=1 Tax=Paraburkholderia dinghuensis TaxID=2305225 RepID=A0A3N6MTF4_9BURK|nr:porin [Paraburkholderia dinghuensis]
MIGKWQHRWRCLRRVRVFVALGTLLVVTPCAWAQASVTLYGVIDTSVEITNPGGGWVTRMDSGAYRGSRFGMRGSEPIGDGTSILFALENGFSSANGTLATAGTLFNRQAWIGAGGPWGEVRVGQQYSPIYIPFKGEIDAFGAGTIASGLNNFSKITPYVSNAITYLLPHIAGFDATVMMALRAPGDNNGNGLAGNFETVSYRYGPLRIAYAHQQTHGSGALRANMGGVTYEIEKTTLFADWFNGAGSGASALHNDGIAVSLRYAFTVRLNASLGYAYVRDLSGKDNDADQFSAMCEYNFSKTLLFYASAGWLRNRNDATFTLRGVNVIGLPPTWPGAPVRGVQLGMIDRF